MPSLFFLLLYGSCFLLSGFYTGDIIFQDDTKQTKLEMHSQIGFELSIQEILPFSRPFDVC